MARRRLDKNEAAFLAALEQDDPDAENWTASWRLMAIARDYGADSFATSLEGALDVCQRLAKRKLVDKERGRSTKTDNGFSLNDAGREALKAHREEGV